MEYKGIFSNTLILSKCSIVIQNAFKSTEIPFSDVLSVNFSEPSFFKNGYITIMVPSPYYVYFSKSARKRFFSAYCELLNYLNPQDSSKDFEQVISSISIMPVPNSSAFDDDDDVSSTIPSWAGKKLNKIPNSFIVTDIETTGLVAGRNSIIEIAALKIENGVIIGEYQSLVHRDKPLSKKIRDITGITTEMLQAEPKDLHTVISEYKSFIGDLPLLGHNIVSFDIRFINHAYFNTFNCPIENNCIDTLTLAKKNITDCENYKLQTLADHLNINVDTAHRAMADCYTTFYLAQYLQSIILTK